MSKKTAELTEIFSGNSYDPWAKNLRHSIVMKTSFKTRVSRMGLGICVIINIFVMTYYFFSFSYSPFFSNLLNQNLHKCEDPKKETREFRSTKHFYRNWGIATNSEFLITISLEPNVADLRYFKLWILLHQIIWVWNIKGLQHRVLKILRFKYLNLFQRLNSFRTQAAVQCTVW